MHKGLTVSGYKVKVKLFLCHEWNHVHAAHTHSLYRLSYDYVRILNHGYNNKCSSTMFLKTEDRKETYSGLSCMSKLEQDLRTLQL
jgi:hypothetical protein